MSALVGVARKAVTSVHRYEQDMILIVRSDNSAYSLNYTHFNNIFYLRYICDIFATYLRYICDIFLTDDLIFHCTEFLFFLVLIFFPGTTVFEIHPIPLDTASIWLSGGTFCLTKHKKNFQNSQTNL
jgi:hypothetical protein